MTRDELVDLVAKQIVLLATDGYNSREMAAAIVPVVATACAEAAGDCASDDCLCPNLCSSRAAARVLKLGGTP